MTPGTGCALEVEDLLVVRGTTNAVDQVSFATRPGEVVGLLGPSGCGKSSLMRALTGVQIVRSGTVRVFGEPAGSQGLRSRVGYVTQAPSVYDDLTVAENLRFFAGVLGLGREEVTRCIDTVDLGAQADQTVVELSGGQRGRASLAVALLGDPDLLVLDEPTVGLDPVLRRDLWKLFHDLADRGRAVIVSSHVMDEAARCDRLLLMREGRLLADDTPEGILRSTGQSDIESAFLQIVARAADEGASASESRNTDAGEPTLARAAERARRGAGMTPRITLAVARRVLLQIRHDHRTLAMLVVLPSLILGLLWWMFRDVGGAGFDALGPALLAIIPFIVMFLVTSVTTLRERSGGTLERLLAMPMGKLDLLLGYALAFGVMATIQSALAVVVSLTLLDLDIAGPVWVLVVVAVADAVLGTALGLFVSAFARTEFQAVQFMPLIVVPQILLCGLFVARDELPPFLSAVSDVMPLSYAVDAMQSVTTQTSDAFGGVDASVWGDLALILAFAVAALAFGAATLRRRTA